MEVKINLRGWADSFSITRYRKLELSLQLAIYETTGDCDWDFRIKVDSKEGYVDKAHTISVTAERVCASGYSIDKDTGEDRVERTFNRLQFSFVVPQYTVSNIYKYAKVAIKETVENNKV